MRRRQLLLLALFVVICIVVFAVSNTYKEQQLDANYHKVYQKSAKELNTKIELFIKEKENSTMAIAIAVSKNRELIRNLKSKNGKSLDLNKLSLKIKENTDFKNVWFQMINTEGVSLSRSWTERKGDNVSVFREEIRDILRSPKVVSTISVGKYDMTFKSIVPIYEKNEFLGLVEVITHFNSISKKIALEGFKSIVLADSKYSTKIERPFTKLFVNDYYVANLGADKELLSYLEKKDMKSYLDINGYYIDKEINSLVTLTTVEDFENIPVGYMLSFKDLDSFSLDDGFIFFKVNLTSFIIISFLALFFLYLSAKGVNLKGNDRYLLLRTASLLIIVFVVLGGSFFFIQYKNYKASSENILNLHSGSANKNYKIIYGSLKRLSNSYNDLLINKDVLELISLGNSEEVTIKNSARDELLTLVAPTYKELKKEGIRQLHFHLKNSESFLRLHRPKIYGDSLINYRDSVAWVNTHRKPIDDFEEGRIFNGFRFVYPLFLEKEHIGSVEFSYSPQVFFNSLLENSFDNFNFILTKESVESNVLVSERRNYKESNLDGFYEDRAIFNTLKRNKRKIDFNTLEEREKEEILYKLNRSDTVFSVAVNSENVLTFIPVKSKLTNTKYGYMVFETKDPQVNRIYWSFFFTTSLGLGALTLLLIFIYVELMHKQKLFFINRKIDTILNSQKSIIILTNGRELKEANRAFFEFTNFPNLEDFLKEYHCICEMFLEKDGKSYLQMDMDGVRWDEYVLHNPNGVKEAYIKDINGNDRYFEVTIEVYDAKERIKVATFNDITERVTYQETLELEIEKAVDKLKAQQQILVDHEKKAALGEMIGVIAHQLKQPLNAIGLYPQMMVDDFEEGDLTYEQLKHYEKTILAKVKFMANSIDDFRNFFNPNKTPSEFSVKEAVDKANGILGTQIRSKGIELKIHCEDGCSIYGFKNDFIQVILNLVSNAKDALFDNEIRGGFIEISSKCINGKTVVEVKDNGGGIPEDIKDQIFEYYFSTKGEKGTGIGLHLAKMIVESMNGKINVSSNEEGSTFILEFDKNITQN